VFFLTFLEETNLNKADKICRNQIVLLLQHGAIGGAGVLIIYRSLLPLVLPHIASIGTFGQSEAKLLSELSALIGKQGVTSFNNSVNAPSND
jgi:hypothetical protein